MIVTLQDMAEMTAKLVAYEGTEIGFTGTRSGMTHKQLFWLLFALNILKPKALHHGDCIGADAQAHTLALMLGVPIHIHPSINPNKRAFMSPWHSAWPPTAPLERNKVIVDLTNLLIAAPAQDYEVQCSGTWATIRHAQKQDKKLLILFS